MSSSSCLISFCVKCVDLVEVGTEGAVAIVVAESDVEDAVRDVKGRGGVVTCDSSSTSKLSASEVSSPPESVNVSESSSWF